MILEMRDMMSRSFYGDKYMKDIKDCCGFAKEVKKGEKMNGYKGDIITEDDIKDFIFIYDFKKEELDREKVKEQTAI